VPLLSHSPVPAQLILRSINSSRSAYASVTFTNTFFDSFNVYGTQVVQAGILAKVHAFALCEALPLHAAVPPAVAPGPMWGFPQLAHVRAARPGALQDAAHRQAGAGARHE
jgi:hypothetical protein